MPVFNDNRGADVLSGGREGDALRGRGGADELEGGRGRDDMRGGRGDDALRGGDGHDRLRGGGGDDVLAGDAGRDRLTGGAGADDFSFAGRWGADVITDFDAAEGDVIDLRGAGCDYADLVIRQTGQGARIAFGGASITLQGVDAIEIDAGFFAFEGGKPGAATTLSGSDLKVAVTGGPGLIGVRSNAAADLAGVQALRADARFAGIDGSGYTVAVLDTGIDLDHAAFGRDADGDGVADRIVYAQDFSSDRDGTPDDVQGHGSHVSSIIASETASYRGVAPGADIAALQVLTNSGNGAIAGIERALRWVIDNAAAYDIVAVNMSLGAGDNVSNTRTNRALGDEFAALDALGVIVAVAAGNDYHAYQRAGVSSIAADPNAIAVGAVWSGNFGRADFGSGAKDFSTAADRLTSFSQRSAAMGEIFAPGAMITGAAPGGGFASYAGTSQATPVVAGMAALAQQIADDVLGRRLTQGEFHALLLSSADLIGDGDDEDDNVANLGVELPRANMLRLAEAILALGPGAPTPEAPNPAPIPDDDDFGDVVAEATRIRPRRDVAGEIETGTDQDVFALRLRAGQQAIIDLRGADAGHGTLADPMLTLYGPDGAAITSDDDGGAGLDARIDFTASRAGTYYIAAQSYVDDIGAYTLRAQTRSLRRSPDDDLPADAATSSQVRLDRPAGGWLETTGDRDWHALDVVAGGEYLIDLEGFGRQGLADPFLRVYDAARRLLAANDDGGRDLDAQLVFAAAADGTIYLEAGAYADAGEGRYRFGATLLSAPGMQSGDVSERSDTAARLAPDKACDGVLEHPGDRDWIAVELVGGALYDFAMVGSGETPLDDAYLRLHDASGAELASDDDGGDGLDALISGFAPRSSGTYYLSAGAFGDFSAGGYTVSMPARRDDDDLPTSRDTESELPVDGSVRARLDHAGDRDWHGVALVAGHVYRIDLRGDGPDGVSDTFLRLYDDDATLVDEDDDGGGDLSSSLIHTAARTGLHFVSAGAYEDLYAGDYSVVLRDLGIADDHLGGVGAAGRLPADGAVAGALEIAGDRDWFQVSLVAGGVYQFDVLGAEGEDGTLRDPVMNLYDAAGRSIVEDDDGGDGLNARITFSANAGGTYFVGVGGFGDDRAGSYRVVSQTLSGDLDDFGDDVDTGGVLDIGAAASGALEMAGDVDWFAVELEGGATYRFDLSGATLDGATLQLRDDDGAVLTFDDDDEGGEAEGGAGITYVALHDGVHYLAVGGDVDGQAETYTLAATQARAAPDDDFGDTLADAGEIAVDGAVSGTLDHVGDRDWLRIMLTAGEHYAFRLLGAETAAGTLRDPLLRLRDGAGVQLRYDDDGGEGLDSVIRFTPRSTGAHYLDVQGYMPEENGTWRLEAELC